MAARRSKLGEEWKPLYDFDRSELTEERQLAINETVSTKANAGRDN